MNFYECGICGDDHFPGEGCVEKRQGRSISALKGQLDKVTGFWHDTENDRDQWKQRALEAEAALKSSPTGLQNEAVIKELKQRIDGLGRLNIEKAKEIQGLRAQLADQETLQKEINDLRETLHLRKTNGSPHKCRRCNAEWCEFEKLFDTIDRLEEEIKELKNGRTN